MPPAQLREVGKGKIFGLNIDPQQLAKIRSERLQSLGLPIEASYASLERVQAELEYAQSLFESLGCPVINVTDRAIEETAGLIMQYF